MLALTNEHPTPGGPRFPGWRRYALALAVAAIGVFVTQLFAGEMFTTPLVGMVVLVSVFLGIGPAHAAIAAAWIALLLYEDPRWEFAIDDNAVARRWAVSLVVALGLVWIGWSLQRRRRKEAERAIEAERESATAKDLQELATSLSAAATPSEVARSLVTLMPDLLGAMGGSLGLIERDEIVIVDPGAAARAALRPGLRLPLTTRSPVATAARTGKPAYANTPREFRRMFPEGAKLVPHAAASLAVPIRAAGRVVGAMGFPFAQPHVVDDAMIGLANVAAGAGGQALERAQLHELEQSARVYAELAADRTRLLQEVAERMSAAATAAEVAEVIAQQATGALAADGVLVYALDADRDQLRLLAQGGVPEEVVEARRLVPLGTPGCLADALDSGEPVALKTRAQFVERYGPSERGLFEPDEESDLLLPAHGRTRAGSERCSSSTERRDGARLRHGGDRGHDLPAGRHCPRPEPRLRGRARDAAALRTPARPHGPVVRRPDVG